jgi:hypothetical protein
VSDFIVRRSGPLWVVFNNEVVYSRHANQVSAIIAAKGSAVRAAPVNGPKRVILEQEDGSHEVIWTSEEHTDTRRK